MRLRKREVKRLVRCKSNAGECGRGGVRHCGRILVWREGWVFSSKVSTDSSVSVRDVFVEGEPKVLGTRELEVVLIKRGVLSVSFFFLPCGIDRFISFASFLHPLHFPLNGG